MKTNIKLLYVCKSLPWRFTGGIQSHTWDLSCELAKMGHSVSILTAGSLASKVKNYYKKGVEIIELPYLPGRYLKPFGLFAEEYFFNLSAKIWLNENHQDYDIVHLQGRSGFLFVNTEKSNRTFATIHGLSKNETMFDRKSMGQRLYAKVTEKLERRSMAQCHKLISVSKDLKAELINFRYADESKISVIPNGIRLVKTNQDEPALDNNHIIFVGRLHPVKGLDTLVEVMKLLPPQIHLSIVGEGPYKSALKKLIADNQLEDRIKLLGQLPRTTIYKLMHKALTLVLPSLSETQGIVLLEANANKTCVIASDLPAIRESIEHQRNGLLCDPNQVNDFVQAILHLHNNPHEAEKMGRQGHQIVASRFSWQAISKLTIDLYRQEMAA